MRHVHVILPLLLLLIPLAACTPFEADHAYVLFDADAQAAGIRAIADGEPLTGALPHRVSIQADLVLLVDGLEEQLVPDPDLVLHVQGTQGRVVESWLDLDTVRSQIVIDGEEDVARDLADLTGASLDEHDGGYLLSLDDVYAALSTLTDLDDLGSTEVFPVSEFDLPGSVRATEPQQGRSIGGLADLLTTAKPANPRAADAESRAAQARIDATWDVTLGDLVTQVRTTASHPPLWVGLYCAADRELLLSADGAARLSDASATLSGAWHAAGDQLVLNLEPDAFALTRVNGSFHQQGLDYRDRLDGGCQ